MNVFSADRFFMYDGKYVFDPAKLNEAHGACLRGFAENVRIWRPSSVYRHVTIMRGIPGSGKSTWIEQHESDLDVVVDNTNILAIDVAPYAALAAAHNLPFEIVTIAVDHKLAAQRNTHGVPAEIVLRQGLPSRWPQLRIGDLACAPYR